MRKKMFLMIFILFILSNSKVFLREAYTVEIDADVTFAKDKVVADFLHAYDYQKNSKDDTRPLARDISGDENIYILKLEPREGNEYNMVKNGVLPFEMDKSDYEIESSEQTMSDIYWEQTEQNRITCSPDYPVPCGDGNCCSSSYPICGYGAYDGKCLEDDFCTNPDYPVPCGNGYCCSSSYPICGYGAYDGKCLEDDGTTTSTITESTTTTTITESTTTTTGGGDCPSDYPMDCGNGWCCSTAYPICGTGADVGKCFKGSTSTTTTPSGSTSRVTLCTEAECDSIEWVFDGERVQGTLNCDNYLSIDVPAGCYTSFASGCGWTWTSDDICVDGYSDKHFTICTGDTGLDCCEIGCGFSDGESDGSFVCDGCPAFDISGSVTGGCDSNVTIKLSGPYEDQVSTDSGGDYKCKDVPSGGPYYITPKREGFTFIPENLTIANLESELHGMDFECIENPPPPPPPMTTTTTICPLLGIYREDSEAVGILRSFRDNVLRSTTEGQEVIELYYQWSPVVVEAMEKDRGFKEEVKAIIDSILPLIRTESE